MFQSNAHWKSNQIKSKVLFKVGTFTNSTYLSSRELFKPTCILRYKLQHNKNNKNKPTCILRYKLQHNKIKNKIMSCIKATYMYQAKIKCKHIYDLISGPPQSVHMWQVPLCTLTIIGPENSIEIDADSYSIYICIIHKQNT
jgi:hypothetical protein